MSLTTSCVLGLQVVLWKNCINCMQSAIMFSKCSPHYNLDLIQLTNLIAEEEGAPSVADIIGRAVIAGGVRCHPVLADGMTSTCSPLCDVRCLNKDSAFAVTVTQLARV